MTNWRKKRNGWKKRNWEKNRAEDREKARKCGQI